MPSSSISPEKCEANADDTTNIHRIGVANPNGALDDEDVQNATHREHALTLRDAFRLYPKAILFSVIFSTAIIMEGYDLSLVGSFYGFGPFKNKFGNQPDPNGGSVISAKWQTSVSISGQCGQILGLYLNGWISDSIGYKRTMLGALVLMIATIFIPFFAQNIETILVGQFMQGLPWGAFQTLTISYASDIAPVILRPYLTAYVNLCWVIGQLIAAGLLSGFLSRNDDWAYRIPFAIQWIWPPLIIVGTLFSPESPWWLVRKGRYDEARKALLSLTSRDCGIEYDVDEQLAMIKATNEFEIATSSGTNYWDCFTGANLRRTEIACVTYLSQIFCGSALMGYSIQFYQRAGLHDKDAFNMNVGQSAMGFVGTCLSWVLMTYLGRRTLYIGGLFILLIILVVVGGAGFAESSTSISWTIGSLLLVYTFVYDLTIGPVCYSIVAEVPSTRLKIKTVVLARNSSNMGGLITTSLMPQMLGIHSWNWGAKSGLFWAAFCLILLIWAYFRLVEPRGRTYGEMDLLFENGVSARKFSSTDVKQFSSDTTKADNKAIVNHIDH